jgi:hypothetical protein
VEEAHWPCRKSGSRVAVMKAAEYRLGNDVTKGCGASRGILSATAFPKRLVYR